MPWWLWVLIVVVAVGLVGWIVQALGTRKELRHLDEHLEGGEQVREHVGATLHAGVAGGVLALTDRRVLFVVHGQVHHVRLEDVRSVEVKDRLVRIGADRLLEIDVSDKADADRIAYAIRAVAPDLGRDVGTHTVLPARPTQDPPARVADPAATLAADMARWGPAPAGSCDICNTGIEPGSSHRVPAAEFHDFVQRGYDPYARGRADVRLAASFGVSAADAYGTWRTMALRDTSDWGLCERCAQDLARFHAERGAA